MNTSENSDERGTLSKVTHDAGRCQTAILKKNSPAIELRCARTGFHDEESYPEF